MHVENHMQTASMHRSQHRQLTWMFANQVTASSSSLSANTSICAGKSAAEAATGTPFRPASLYAKHLGKQPEYIHDPELPKIEAEKTKKREEIKRLAATGPWKPNMSSKSDMTRSIIRMNI